MANNNDKRTLIALLASHDDPDRNKALAKVLDRLVKNYPDRLSKFRFVFTGGTYERLIGENSKTGKKKEKLVKDDTKDFLLNKCGVIRLPNRKEGGVTILAYLITQRIVSIIWPFFTPRTSHWLTPENLALMRLCDLWHVKRLMNTGSVEEWFNKEAERDINRDLQDWPPKFDLKGSQTNILVKKAKGEYYEIKVKKVKMPSKFDKMTVALISHDEMKLRMSDFAIDCEQELAEFKRILSTGTTGRLVAESAPDIAQKIYRYHSGPKGGDIEIATEILFGQCHVVIFFVDPLNPHPHIEDIRVVFGACMIEDKVRMLSNEMQAREWIDRVVRYGKDPASN